MKGISSPIETVGPKVGDIAPDFELPALIGGVKQRFRLSQQLATKNVILAFYPLNWELVSAQQLVKYQAERENFTRETAEVVTISVDSIMNTTAWERDIGPFDFPLCSDFWPHGEVSHRYGVLRQTEPYAGASERAVFIIERSGRIRFRKIYQLHQVAGIEETLNALASL